MQQCIQLVGCSCLLVSCRVGGIEVPLLLWYNDMGMSRDEKTHTQECSG